MYWNDGSWLEQSRGLGINPWVVSSSRVLGITWGANKEIMKIVSFFISDMYYIYIIYSPRSDKYYIGMTSDVARRLEEHNDPCRENKYTLKHICWSKLLFSNPLYNSINNFTPTCKIIKRKVYFWCGIFILGSTVKINTLLFCDKYFWFRPGHFDFSFIRREGVGLGLSIVILYVGYLPESYGLKVIWLSDNFLFHNPYYI